MADEVILETSALASLYKLKNKGKVRDVYEIDDRTLLFVATDRISAFDVVLANGIPHKGALLTVMTLHWLNYLKKAVPTLKTHFVSLDLPKELEGNPDLAHRYRLRAMQVRKLQVLPIESIVRGYITGSAWAEYKKFGTVHGMPMPAGMLESERLKEPIWTPSTKAPAGEKDENISPSQARELIGAKYASQVERFSLAVYVQARGEAERKGIIIADTKLEFGVDPESDEVVLIDEVLTPDSSRFWSARKYQMGRAQESLDKQELRDWLVDNGLKGKEGVEMPRDVVQQTANTYRTAFEKLVGTRWDVIVAGREG